tara:strand:+ start:3146 stop:3922 length:777 start_codon:yes stop_codon:yes gene_type:complete
MKKQKMFSKKFITKYKQDIIALSAIISLIILISSILIYMNITRRNKIESFNNFKMKNMNTTISKYIARFKRPTKQLVKSKQVVTSYSYDTKVIDNVYLIEQTRNVESKMDDYTVKSNIGSIIFNAEGLWDLYNSKFQLVSTGGQSISVEDIGSNGYFFSIGNIKISFYYKRVKVFGKIIIDDAGQQIILYMRNNKKYTNFYTEDNKRVAYSKLDTVISNVYTTRLIITKKYNQYYNIFIIILITYLQIFKDQHNTVFL